MGTYPFLQSQSQNTDHKQEEEGEHEPKSNVATEDGGRAGNLGTYKEEPQLGRRQRFIFHWSKTGLLKQRQTGKVWKELDGAKGRTDES